MDAGRPICTCCEQRTDELVTAPRRDGSPQSVCKRCRVLIVEGKGWDDVYASVRLRPEKGEHAVSAREWSTSFERGDQRRH